jgi:hypothetical protein
MADPFLQFARKRLQTSDLELARKLELPVGCLRSWDRRGTLSYAKLALAALIIGLDPDDGSIWGPAQSARRPPAAK